VIRQVIIGLVVSLACLAWVLRKLDFALLWNTIQHINWLYFIAVNFLLAISLWLRALRWRLMLEPVKKTSLGNLFWATIIGFGANNMLPARLGELVRAYALGRLEQIPATSALATVLLERVLDGMVLLLVLFLALLFIDPQAKAGAFTVSYLKAAGYGLLVVYLGVMALAAALWRWPQATIRLVSGLIRKISDRLEEKAVNALTSFHQGLAMLGRGHGMPAILLLSLLVWLVFWGIYWVFLPAVGLPLSLILAAMAMAGGGLGAAVPAGPGYIGTFQLAVTWALIMAGAGAQQALAYSLLIWAATYFPLTGAALIVMWQKGMALARIQGEISKEKEAGSL
jgi:uncharacterized protein (TIRG00374 family)